jgi:sugar/nucleoside kinase (ribokinase family)
MDGSVAYDVVCAGPVSLDVTLVGLDELPRPGEERFGDELVFSPGAFATIAVGVARLGLRAAVIAPKPRDLAGAYLASALAAEGVAWLGAPADRAAITFVMPLAGDRALASYDPVDRSEPTPLAGVNAAAFVLGPGELAQVPRGASAYVMTGSVDDRPWLERPSPNAQRPRALFANEREAVQLTGADGVEEAARRLGASAETAVVTRAAAGALGVHGDEVVRVDAPEAEARDTTGAGDLFASAYIWADGEGLPLEERLRWAALYASLSVAVVGAIPGAANLAELLAAGRRRGLTPPR